ncbi:protein FAM200C-like [Macrobrachium rosenbergii]|uniref:protein FAM200C-like n=1 Tax=Macrobrachium rosenbergii TaxID=79674 RepID=UPI0034D570EB
MIELAKRVPASAIKEADTGGTQISSPGSVPLIPDRDKPSKTVGFHSPLHKLSPPFRKMVKPNPYFSSNDCLRRCLPGNCRTFLASDNGALSNEDTVILTKYGGSSANELSNSASLTPVRCGRSSGSQPVAAAPRGAMRSFEGAAKIPGKKLQNCTYVTLSWRERGRKGGDYRDSGGPFSTPPHPTRSSRRERRMDKFVVRKRKDQMVASSIGTASKSNIEGVPGPSESNCEKGKHASLSKKRTYIDAYLAYGFTSNNDEDDPRPVCLVSGASLSNEAMVPSKLKRHLNSRHPFVSQWDMAYFSRLLEGLSKAATKMVNKVSVADTTLEASFRVSELIAKKMKPHTTGEEIIGPACNIIVETMLGKEAQEQISKDIVEQFMFCKELPTTTTGEDIFASVNSYLTEHGLSWNYCCGICTGGAPSMIGNYKDFITRALKENPSIITTHRFLHREALVAKTCREKLTEVLKQKLSRWLISSNPGHWKRLFQKMCQEMGAAHISLILHTDIRWLSRGVLYRVLELKEELKAFFREERHDIFIKLLENHTWCLKLSYLADIFMKLNELNLLVQGRLQGIVTSVNKMKGFQRKLKSWTSAVQKDDVSNFPSLQHPGYNGLGTVKNLILNHLEQLREAVDKYFPSLSTEKLDWIVSPFKLADMAEELDFTAIEHDEFLDMSADSTLKVKFEKSDVTLAAFWHGTLEEHPNLAKKAISVLLPFSTSYLCEQAFYAMATIKSKQRNRLLSLEDDMRVALSYR